MKTQQAIYYPGPATPFTADRCPFTSKSCQMRTVVSRKEAVRSHGRKYLKMAVRWNVFETRIRFQSDESRPQSNQKQLCHKHVGVRGLEVWKKCFWELRDLSYKFLFMLTEFEIQSETFILSWSR